MHKNGDLTYDHVKEIVETAPQHYGNILIQLSVIVNLILYAPSDK